MKGKRKLLATLLALCMLLSLLPVMALAAEPVEWTKVGTLKELSAALEAGGNIQLTENITVATAGWNITQDVVLDLNNQTISSSYDQINNYIMTVRDASLTIMDTSADKGGKIEATDSSYGYGIQLRSGASFTLLAGTIETTQETLDIYTSASNCSVTISGGKLISSADSAMNVRGENTTVTITGGELVSAGRTGIYISNYGEPDSIQFTMTGGSLTHTEGRSGAIQLYKGATVTIGGEAKLTSESYVIQAQENTILNVEGGNLESSGSYAISAADESTVNITGGSVASDRDNIYISGEDDKPTIRITAGTFSSDVRAYVEAGSDCTTEGSNYVVSADAQDILKITEFGYFADGADANADLGVTDCADQTLYVKLSGKLNTGNYWLELVAPDGKTVAPWVASSLGGAYDYNLIYWSFQNSTQNFVNMDQNGIYTMNLYAYTGETSSPTDRPANMQLIDSATVVVTLNESTLIKITDFGFKADADAANAELGVDDCAPNTMWIQLSAATSSDTYYWGELVAPNGDKAPWFGTTSSDSTFNRVYWSFDNQDQNVNTVALTSGTYTFYLYTYDGNSTGPDDRPDTMYLISTKALTISQISYALNGGEPDSDSIYVQAGDTITLPAAPSRSGYTFTGWNDGTDTYGAEAIYTVPNADVTLTAQWSYNAPISSSTYTITVSSADNGSVAASALRASAGAVISLTATPDEGYALDTITVTDAAGNAVTVTGSGNSYSFTMPESAVTVQATFRLASELPFIDVDADDWFFDEVAYAYNNGLMEGVSADRFAPDSTLTRSAFAVILWRIEGEPVVNYQLPFEDVAEDAWYAEAVRWAASEGIVLGVSDTAYAPDTAITREQLATMLYRYAQYLGMEAVTLEENLTGFADAADVSEYAVQAMNWAVGAGLIEGVDSTTLRPQGSATRAQTAAILVRMSETFAQQ